MMSSSRSRSHDPSLSGMTDRRPCSMMKLSPISQPIVDPSWNSEFIQG